MKRLFNVLLCCLLISALMGMLISGVYAAEDADVGAGTDADAAAGTDADATSETGAVSKGQQLIDEIKNAPENPLDKTVSIPEYLRIPAGIIFGVSENISLEVLIILLMVWVIFFVIVLNVLKVIPSPMNIGSTPLFENEWTALLGAFALATLMGLTGAIKFAAEFFLGVGNLFEFLGRWSPGAIIFALVLVAAIFAVVSKILGIFRGMKREADIEKAKNKGADIGA